MEITKIPNVQQLESAFNEADHFAFEISRRLDVPIWVFDIDNKRVVFANDAACELWDAETEDALRSRNFNADMSATVHKRLKQYQADFIASDAAFTEQWTLYPKGAPKSVMVVFRGYRLVDGRMAMLCEVKSTEETPPQNLRSAEALLYTDVIITLLDRDGLPLYLNPAARNAFPSGIDRFQDIFVDQSIFHRLTAQVDIMGEYKVVTKIQSARGQRWYEISAKTCSDAVTGAPSILVTAFDVSELKEARDIARRLADRDQLTNLHNRAYLQRFFANLASKPDTERCAAVFFDVDRFKLINDRFGHDAGDTVLKHIADSAYASLEPNDLVARLGGDEFVMIIKHFENEDQLLARIDKLRRSFGQTVWHDQTQIHAEVSVGVAIFSPKTAYFPDVLREADIALYKSKEAGRNQATIYTDEMGAAARARDLAEIELASAVKNNEFELFYQPRVDIAAGRIVCAEGLVRWNHPSRGIVGPSDFVSICEETGLIDELGRQVLEMGCAQAIEWRNAGLDIGVSLNVSPRQFSDKQLLETLARLSEHPDFSKGSIELEITENALIGDHVAIAEKLKVITAMGYKIAIDDFGTGYSNLSYISRFPLSCLKIDRTFIDQLPASGPIVTLILTLGQQIGATIVSEGVETQDHLDWLIQNKCDQAQGYLITRPLPVKDFLTFVQSYKM